MKLKVTMDISKNQIFDYIKSVLYEIVDELTDAGADINLVIGWKSHLTQRRYVGYGFNNNCIMICYVEDDNRSPQHIVTIDNAMMFEEIDMMDHDKLKERLAIAFAFAVTEYSKRKWD